MVLNYNNIKNVKTNSGNPNQVDISKYYSFGINHAFFHSMSGQPFFFRGQGRGTVTSTHIFQHLKTMSINTTSSYAGGFLFPMMGHDPRLHGDIIWLQFGTQTGDSSERLMVVTKNGYVLGAGENAEGWLAQGNTTDVLDKLVEIYDPTDYSNDKAIKARITSGSSSHASDTTCYILTAGGKLWAAGDGNHGKLGQGSTTDSNTLVQTQDTSGAVSNFIDFETQYGDDTTAVIAVKSDNSLWSLGDGGTDILGNGNTSDYTTFTSIAELPTKKVKKIIIISSLAEASAHILYDDGALWHCGDNYRGRLGKGDTVDVNTYFEADTGVDDIYTFNRSDQESSTMNSNIITRKGSTYYLAGRALYNILLNNASNGDVTSFTQMGTALPSGFAINKIYDNEFGDGHNQGNGFIKIYNSSTNEYRIHAPMYNIDGNMGNNTQTSVSNPASSINDTDITDFLPCRAHEVEYMLYTGGNAQGSLSWLLDKFGNVYACGAADSYNGTSATQGLNTFPFFESPRERECENWQRVVFLGQNIRWA